MKRGSQRKTGKSAEFGQKTHTFTHFNQVLLVITYIFVYFDIFSNILTKSYWAQYFVGLG